MREGSFGRCLSRHAVLVRLSVRRVAESAIHLSHICPPLFGDQASTVRSRRNQLALFQFRLDVPLNHERLVARGAFVERQKRGFRFGTEFFWHARLLPVLKNPTMTECSILVSGVMLDEAIAPLGCDAAPAKIQGTSTAVTSIKLHVRHQSSCVPHSHSGSTRAPQSFVPCPVLRPAGFR